MGKQNATTGRIDEAFAEIVRIAREVQGEADYPEHSRLSGQVGEEPRAEEVGCTIKSLPSRLAATAADFATRINPANAPLIESAATEVIEPAHLTILTAKYWGPAPRKFTVSFLDNPSRELRARIISHLNAWSKSTNRSFAETAGTGEVRIAREADGYWSYLGTDVLVVPPQHQTMNLQGFTMSTDESEFRRVIRHEAGHTLGFPHEHMRRELVNRIDREKAYRYFEATQGWPREMVDRQVLTALNERSILGTPADQDSIMCYRLPGSITRDGQPIRGGVDINATDYAFAGLIYPKTSAGHRNGALPSGPDWGAEQDVVLPF